MKTCLVSLLYAGLLLLPSAALAQDDFAGRWGVDGSTQLADIGVSPFGASPVFTQTADTISWQSSDGRQQTLRLNGPSVIYGRTYTARWVERTLLLESRTSLPNGGAFVVLQILLRNAADELELISVAPVLAREGVNVALAREGTDLRRLVYRRRN